MPIDAVSQTLNCELCGIAMVKKQPFHRRGWFMGCARCPLCRCVATPRDVQTLALRQKSARIEKVEFGILERTLMETDEPSRSS
eukprot:6478893-Amphidinium_carterae.1